VIPVTELKQWAYCQRVVYYHQIMPGAGQATFKMKEGTRAQEMIESLEMRRTLREYRFEGASRQFGLWLTDEGLGLNGKIDLLLRRSEDAGVVDFKLSAGAVGENHRMQLAGYALLVEAAIGLKVPMTFLFRIPDNMVFPVPITDEMRMDVRRAIEAIQRLKETEELPEPTSVRGRCTDCEYANFCGDIW